HTNVHPPHTREIAPSIARPHISSPPSSLANTDNPSRSRNDTGCQVRVFRATRAVADPLLGALTESVSATGKKPGLFAITSQGDARGIQTRESRRRRPAVLL